jgi:tRNA(Ile)-lysidine synthetase-like protein
MVATMNVQIRPGAYVVAVSGGVDSMVLLDVLAQMPDLKLVVAHFEHGIREDSDVDRQFVEAAAKRYGLPFIYEHGNLGVGVSESAARDARYAFLQRVREERDADAIVTAHHQDDLIETAVINIMRGTGRKGLSSLQSTKELVRPLLDISKQQILDYAQEHHIAWHEDSTNQDDAYLRNYIRHNVIPRLGEEGRQQLYAYIEKAQELNPEIDILLTENLEGKTEISRYWFIMLPYDVSCETMAAWLRQNDIREFDRRAIERLVVAAKVALPGKQSDIDAEHFLKVSKTNLCISPRLTS